MLGPTLVRAAFFGDTEEEIVEALTDRTGGAPTGPDWWVLTALLWEERRERGAADADRSILAAWSGAILGYAAAGAARAIKFRDEAQREYEAALKRAQESRA